MRRRPGSILFVVMAVLAVAGPTLPAADDSTGSADLALPATYRATMMILDQLPKGTVKMSGGAEGSGAGGGIVVGGGPAIGIGTIKGVSQTGTYINEQPQVRMRGSQGRGVGESPYMDGVLE